MFPIDNSTAIAVRPATPAAGTPGWFTNGNPASGVPGTVIDADFWNMLIQELKNVLLAASITPAKGTENQLLQSLQVLIPQQSIGVVGSTRGLKMSVATASATATVTADQIVVATALNGSRAIINTYSQTINLATTGAGGMDTGSAPASGYVALYAIYGASGTSIVATNATSSVAPTVYGGTNMPSGYTYSALISVRPTNSIGQFTIGYQNDRFVSIGLTYVLNSSALPTSYTSLSLAGAIPLNATSIRGIMQVYYGGLAGPQGVSLAASNSAIGQQYVSGYVYTSGTSAGCNYTLDLITPKMMYYIASGPSVGGVILISGYLF